MLRPRTRHVEPRSQTAAVTRGLEMRLERMIDGRMQHHGIVGEGRDSFTGAVYLLDTVGCASTGVGIRGELSSLLNGNR